MLSAILVLLMAGIPLTILYFLYKYLRKKGLGWLGIVIIISFSFYFLYSGYTALYPTDQFYLDEFKEVTLRNAPSSIQVLRKAASYPDFHGDYCSASAMTLSESDYKDLLQSLIEDNKFVATTEKQGSQEFYNVMSNYVKMEIEYGFVRNEPAESDHYRYIGFMEDRRTIIVHLCVT